MEDSGLSAPSPSACRRRPGMPPLSAASLAVEGINCWRRVRADRMAFLIDAQDYYTALKAALREARHSVLLLGWEFDSRTRLERGESESSGGIIEPNTIGDLLRWILRQRPALEVHVLIWDSALIYSFDREFLPVLKHGWLSHPRLHFRLDDAHPFGASHHQKIVVIDDRVAFLGGLDVSSRRWDSSEHRPRDPRRSDPGFPGYPPFHDVQVAVSGPAAAALGDLARRRWRNATGHSLSAPPADPHPSLWPDPWPAGLTPDLRNVIVALARSHPPWEGEPAVREVERLFADMIRAARRHIYVENQYFACRVVARTLARRLREAEPPEIAVVTSGFSSGFLERTTMGASRSRLQARLQALDGRHRLHLYAPMIGGHPLKVHAKVMVVDDSLLRIGSANLNNRSMGLDTECDLLLEAGGDPAIARAIAAFRHRLLAEHLGCPAAIAAAAEAEHGLAGAIARLGGTARRLAPLAADPAPREPAPPQPAARQLMARQLVVQADPLDPDGPVETLLMAAAEPTSRHHPPLAARFATGMGLLGTLALAAILWRILPPAGWMQGLDGFLLDIVSWRTHPLAPLLVIGLFLLMGLTGLPLFLTVVAVASLFGGWLGAVYSLLGALASAGFTYSVGATLGRHRIRRLIGPRASRVSRALVRHGIIAIAMMRLLPVAAFTTINLMAGATGIRRRGYLLGSLLGLVPMIGGLSAFGAFLMAVLRRATPHDSMVLMLVTLGLAVAGTGLLTRLRRAAEHRPAAEAADGRK